MAPKQPSRSLHSHALEQPQTAGCYLLVGGSSNPTTPIYTHFLQHTIHISVAAVPPRWKGPSSEPEEFQPVRFPGTQKGLPPLKDMAIIGMCCSKVLSVGNLVLKFMVEVFEAEHLTGGWLGLDDVMIVSTAPAPTMVLVVL